MKKILLIIFLSFLWSSNAQSFFSNPIEKCMDRVQEEGLHINYAAKICNNFTKDSIKCMKKVVNSGMYVTAAAKRCFGT